MTFSATSKFRYISLLVGAAFVFAALALSPQGILAKIGAAIGAAFLTWIATIWLDTYKSKTAILANHYASLKENIERIDSCLFELRKANKSVQGGLAMRWAGQSIEEWNANAMAAWNEIHSTMEELTKALWFQRAFLADFDQLEQDINNLTFNLKAILNDHIAWQNKHSIPPDIDNFIKKCESVNALIPELDARLRAERLKILNDSLTI